MKSDSIAIIGLPTLESVAVRMILSRYHACGATEFDSLASAGGADCDFRGYVASCEAVLSGLDFFLPRKGNTAVVTATEASSLSGFTVIGPHTPESEIIERLGALASRAEYDADQPHGKLSGRELEVLREIAAGLTNKEIADRLCISVNTVITHRKNLTSKLGIRSASGLSLYAMMNGII